MERSGTRIRYLLLLYIALLVSVLLSTVLFWGRIKANLARSMAKEHVLLWLDDKSLFSTTDVECVLFSAKGPVTVQRKMGATRKDELHYRLENLLSDLSTEELQQGLVSFIPKDTKLIGATFTEAHGFVELSEEFLSSPDIDKALEQMKKTLGLAWETEGLNVYSGDKVFSI